MASFSRVNPRAFLLACRFLWIVLTLLIIVVVYLSWLGFPEFVVRHVEGKLQSRGYDVRIDRMKLAPFEGVVAYRVEWYVHASDMYPSVNASKLIFGFDPRVWLLGRSGLHSARIRRGQVRVDTAGPLTNPDAPTVVTFEPVRADLGLESGGIRLHGFEANAMGIQMTGRGFLVRDEYMAVPLPDEPGTDLGELLHELLDNNRAWLTNVVTDVGAMAFRTPPSAEFDFILYTGKPERNRITVHISGDTFRYRGLLFDTWKMESILEDGTVTIPSIRLSVGGRSAEARLTYDVPGRIMHTKIHSDLLPVYWRNLLPDRLRAPLEQARVHFLGETEVQVELGPARIAELHRHARGTVRLSDVDAHGVWLDTLSSQITVSNEVLFLSGIDGTVGRDEQRGPVKGSAKYDWATMTYQGEVTASFHPHAVLPIAAYAANAANMIQSLVFPEAHPEIDVKFSGKAGEDASFNFSGDMRGSRFIFHGSYVDEFDAHFNYTNRIMRLEPLIAKRDEGELTGWFQLDFSQGVSDFDIESAVHPKALGRLAGPMTGRILRPFHFEGPISLKAQGRLDYRNHDATDYVAHGVAHQAGWRWITADTLTADWIALGNRITMTNIHAEVYGGQLDGHVNLHGVGGDDLATYEAALIVRGVRFSDLLRHAKQEEEEHRRGALSGTLTVSGVAGDAWRETIGGEGSIRVREGEIFRIPLLGGLSGILSRIYSGFGFAAQTDVRADFTIEDRRIESEEIIIEGTILSLKALGYYDLDDQLNVRLQVVPLRRGVVVDAIRIVTYPVSRLLQLRLEGTLSDPVWRIENLPRELRQYF